jgi:hypothetical protein
VKVVFALPGGPVSSSLAFAHANRLEMRCN